MQERGFGHIEPGMDVCDMDGEKIGTVTHVYRHAYAPTGGMPSSGIGTAPGDELIEIKTGLFGLGKHYYIPFSAIHDVTTGCVFVSQRREDLNSLDWDIKPDYLNE